MEMTLYLGGLGSVGWLVDHYCPQLSFDLSERRRRQIDATFLDLLKLNTRSRSAKWIECKLTRRSATGTCDHGRSQECNRTESSCADYELEQQENQESGAPPVWQQTQVAWLRVCGSWIG